MLKQNAELKQRIITAILLALVLIASTFLPSHFFAVWVGFIVVMGGWEWANLAGFEKNWQRFVYCVLVICALGAVPPSPTITLIIGSLFWVVALMAVTFYPASARYWSHSWCRAFMGLIVLSCLWASFVTLHLQSKGTLLVLMLWALVALADISAFFVGHACGKKKLAPLVSPGKTWEGVYGALIVTVSTVFVTVLIYAASLRSAIFLAGLAAIIVGASILGDLFESMLKRFRGVKDSGQLLPGHGGVLDRIDGWTAAAPIYALAVVYSHLFIPPQ